jgi:hypothetical protein
MTLHAYGQNWPNFPSGQNNDPDWGNLSDKVWHKNMELVLPVNFSAPFDGEQFSTGYIKYVDASSQDALGQFVLVAVNQYDFHYYVDPSISVDYATYNSTNYVGPSRIQVFDVTNPRTACIALEIMLKTSPSVNLNDDTTYAESGNYYTLKNTSIWTDSDGHTFLAANVQEKDGVLIDEVNQSDLTDDIYTRVLIIDLTAALSKVRASGATSNVIIIGNVKSRNSAYVRGASGTTFSDVYIGYIPRDDVHFTTKWKASTSTPYTKVVDTRCQNHTMTCDQRSSVLSINPLNYSEFCDINAISGAKENVEKHGYVDLYLMNSISGNAYFSSTTDFVEPTRITTSGNIPICVDVVIGTDTYYTQPHEAHAHSMKVMVPQGTPPYTYMIPHATDFEADQIMLNVASFADSKEYIDDYSIDRPLGGGIIFKVDWSSSGPGNATVTQEQYWGYGDDRSLPNDKSHTGYTVDFKDVDLIKSILIHKNYHNRTDFVLPTRLMDGMKPLSNRHVAPPESALK